MVHTHIFDYKCPFFILELGLSGVLEECDGRLDVLRDGPDNQPSVGVLNARLPRMKLAKVQIKYIKVKQNTNICI